MLVVLVMRMPVIMLHRFVLVLVLVALRKVQINPQSHQQRCNEELGRDRLREQGDRERRADERRSREIRAGPGAAQRTKRQNKQHQTNAVAK